MKYKRNHRRSKRTQMLSATLILTIILFFCLSVTYTTTVFPALSAGASAYINREMNELITNAVISYIEENDHEEFITITYTQENKVSSIKANVNAVNYVRFSIGKSIIEGTESAQIKEVVLPLGCIFNNEMLYARGPRLRFRVISSENFISRVETDFIERGINQTLFELYITYELDVKVSMPMRSVTLPIKMKYLLCESVIVGDIPEAYTDINRSFDDITESEIDDINDFGAHK